jgi:hypothetical protein
VNPPAPAAEPSQRRPATTAFWLTIVITGVWALSNATLCHAVFENSIRYLPAQPDTGSIPKNEWTRLVPFVAPVALAFFASPVIAPVTGFRYLRSVRFASWPWLTLWAVAAAAAVTAEVLLLRAAIPVLAAGGHLVRPAHGVVDNGPKVLAFAFVISGLALLGVMILASRAASRPPAPGAGQPPAPREAGRAPS